MGRGSSGVFRLTLVVADAALAFVHTDLRTAAQLAQEARNETYHGRSLAPLVMLETDSRHALGERDQARALYQALRRPVPYGGDDIDVWASLRLAAEQGLQALSK